MLVLDIRDQQGKLWLPHKCSQNKQPDNTAFALNSSCKSIGTYEVINTINPSTQPKGDLEGTMR